MVFDTEPHDHVIEATTRDGGPSLSPDPPQGPPSLPPLPPGSAGPALRFMLPLRGLRPSDLAALEADGAGLVRERSRYPWPNDWLTPIYQAVIDHLADKLPGRLGKIARAVALHSPHDQEAAAMANVSVRYYRKHRKDTQAISHTVFLAFTLGVAAGRKHPRTPPYRPVQPP